MSETLVIGDLTFEVRRSARRTTLGLTVDRDGSLILALPADCPAERAERFARDKLVWVYTKLAEKDDLAKPAPAKQYVGGEGFYYLGRSYRLLLVDPDPARAFLPPLRLFQGRFLLRRDAQYDGRAHFIAWYTAHTCGRVTEAVGRYANRVQVRPAAIHVMDLGAHWGSCGAGGALNFHWRAAMLPPHVIEYVALHELVHLHEPDHGAGFWARVARAMPDYEARRRWLDENGARFAL
ncbi:MAG: M48 family metallopeptidase [Anaerolineae bacterium]|nr:M48 family metallopeptidase [Anaerolineae bacterium]